MAEASRMPRAVRALALALVIGLAFFASVTAPSASASGSPVLFAMPTAKHGTCGRAHPCTLAQAIAHASRTGGTIELARGAYEVSSPLTLDNSLPVSIVGSAAGSVLIGNGLGPALTLSGPGSITMTALTLRAAPAGAILDRGGALTVLGSTFADDGSLSPSVSGGAIDFSPASGASTLQVQGSTFVDDLAGEVAGAIALGGGAASIEGSTFIGDRVIAGAGAVGGSGVVGLQGDVLARTGAGACAPGATLGPGVIVAASTCDGAPSAPLARLFIGGKPGLASNGGPVKTVALNPSPADPALDAIPASQASLTDPAATYCSLADARGDGRLLPGATACASGAVQPDPPVIQHVSPEGGGVGTEVTLSGSGFGRASSVSIETVLVPFKTTGDTTLTFSVPPGVFDANAPVVVKSPDGTTATTFLTTGRLVVSTAEVPATEVGANYSAVLVADGGTGGNHWTASGLPPGVSLAANGLLNGHPLKSSNSQFKVSVVDNHGDVASASLQLVVAPGPLIKTTRLPEARLGEPYAVAMRADGGVRPYRWAIAPHSSIPGGLLLSSSGVLSGRPGTVGTTSVEIQVVDARGGSDTVRFSFEVAPPPPPPERYALLTSGGRLLAFGSSPLDTLLARRQTHFVALAADPRHGWWALAASGRVVGAGGAHGLGSVGPVAHASQLVGIASNDVGTGYWVADSQGHVFGFGSARALTATAGTTVTGPVVGIAADPVANGYWLIQASGKVDAFGAAPGFGYIGKRLRVHAVGMAALPDGEGYLVLTSSGRVYTFGSAHALGGLIKHPGRFVGIAASPVGAGYWVLSWRGYVNEGGTARELAPSPAPTAGAVAIASGR
jgi:hypothetical protein